MNLFELTNRIESLIAPVLKDLGFELVEARYLNEQGRWFLRVFIEKDGGNITTDNCAEISRTIGSVLDVENIIPGRYNLEVSSPGLDRVLKKKEDFEKFKGNLVRLKTKLPINGRGNYFGKLDGMDGENILMTVDGVNYIIPFTQLAKAKIEYTGEKK